MHFLILFTDGSYDVVNEKDIWVDAKDEDSAMVKIKLKEHYVQVVKKGLKY